MHRGMLEMGKVSMSVASLRDQHEPASIVRNALLSQEDELSTSTVTTTEEEEGTVEGELREQRMQ